MQFKLPKVPQNVFGTFFLISSLRQNKAWKYLSNVAWKPKRFFFYKYITSSRIQVLGIGYSRAENHRLCSVENEIDARLVIDLYVA